MISHRLNANPIEEWSRTDSVGVRVTRRDRLASDVGGQGQERRVRAEVAAPFDEIGPVGDALPAHDQA